MEYNSNHKRYFDNPFLGNPESGARIATDEWIIAGIENLASIITNRRSNREEMEEVGPYIGISGIAYAFVRASKAHPQRRPEYARMASDLLSKTLSLTPSQRSKTETQFLTGGLGLYVVACASNHLNGQTSDSLLARIEAMSNVVVRDGFQGHGDDELFVGRAGYLNAILTLRSHLQHDIVSDSKIRAVLDAIIISGRTYAKTRRFAAPLLYQYHGTEYLGAAHGLACILQMLMSFDRLLDDAQRSDVKETVDWLVSIQQRNGNIAPDVESTGQELGENELVHWCHGAPGVILLFMSAYIVFEQPAYLEAARRCADLIWQRGVLKKGPGICHGVAGNGYAFLLMYRLTGEQDYLNKAKAFANIMMDTNFQKAARTPDFPYSLFEGLAGSLCFLADLLDPSQAQFPLYHVPFNK
ncbi:Lanthionine synthetase C-like protein [Aphelenchoides avenae]|nr:Lanthionine synthetase C-like protein [Aphelenchus avenae]